MRCCWEEADEERAEDEGSSYLGNDSSDDTGDDHRDGNGYSESELEDREESYDDYYPLDSVRTV